MLFLVIFCNSLVSKLAIAVWFLIIAPGLALGTQSSENHSSDKVLVIGLGQLGLPVAKYVKEKGFDVYGY